MLFVIETSAMYIFYNFRSELLIALHSDHILLTEDFIQYIFSFKYPWLTNIIKFRSQYSTSQLKMYLCTLTFKYQSSLNLGCWFLIEAFIVHIFILLKYFICIQECFNGGSFMHFLQCIFITINRKVKT